MKRNTLYLAAALSLWVALNAWLRTGGPSLDLGSDVAETLLRPGTCALWYLGFTPDSAWELTVVVILSWWAWLAVARLIWCIVGRAFGIVNMADYWWWLLFVPPWRPCHKLWQRVRLWWKQFRYGPEATAQWTSALTMMTLVYAPDDCIYLGRLLIAGIGLYQTIGLRGARHVNVIAAPGSGKTRWAIGWLGMLHKKASALITDCDGQIVNAVGAALERAGHLIYNLDPYRLSKFPGACWNALDELTRCAERHGREAVVRFAQTLAEATIREDNTHQPVFANTARNFIHGLILYVWLFEGDFTRNLVRVRDLLTRGLAQGGFDALLTAMLQAPMMIDDRCGGQITAVIARAGALMQSGQRAKDGNPFRTTAISQTSWLDLPEIAAISRYSDFSCADLKTGNPCVFICAPVTDIQTKLSGFVRALTMMTAYTFQNMPNGRRGKIPCLFLIDEAPSLGRIEMFETASAVFRHFGIRLVMIMQDLGQLKKVYPDNWETFLGSAECNIWMSTSHQFTLEYLSKLLGTTTHTTTVKDGLFSKVPPRVDKTVSPLAYPHQLAELMIPWRKIFIVTRGVGSPMKIAYDGYDRSLPITHYDHDDNYKEPYLRAFTRRAYAWLYVQKPPQGPRRVKPA